MPTSSHSKASGENVAALATPARGVTYALATPARCVMYEDVETAIERIVATAPPLTDAQCRRLAGLLGGAS